ncbi:hypothetical protein [Burkholderia pseudomallei]|uniref:hypothetical protein n=1 Tax=Burkholderia pseudomallei TaxID=28450 RepID=UPI0012FCC772
MAAAVAVLFAFGSYTRCTTVDGVVVPDVGLVKVYAQQPGMVLRKAVTEGELVTRGTVLYTVSTELQSTAGAARREPRLTQQREIHEGSGSRLGWCPAGHDRVFFT